MNSFFNKAIAILHATPKVQFVIVAPDGTQYVRGNLQFRQRKKRPSKHPFGTLMLHYKPYLKNLNVGEVAEIPFDKFEFKSLRSAISAYCCTNWGKGAAITSISDDKKYLEVFRVK